MQNIIGISAPSTPRVLQIIATLREQLNLLHICMQAPAHRAIAGLLNETEHNVTRHIEPHRYYPQWGLTAAELSQKISLILRTGNRRCFIEFAENAMAEHANSPAAKLFNGFIISGIGTESEAEWLRNSGGKLLHIYDTQYHGDYLSLQHHYVDLAINAGLADEHSIAHLTSALTLKKEAA